MTPDAVFSALVAAWDELPSLVGPEWVHRRPAIEAVIERLEADPTYEAHALAAAEVLAALRHYPAARARLAAQSPPPGEALGGFESSAEWRTRSTPTRESDRKTVSPGVIDRIKRMLSPEPATVFVEMCVPAALERGQRLPLTVGLAAAPRGDCHTTIALDLRLGADIEARLYFPAEGIEVVGPASRSLRADPGTDSPPAVFFVRGLSPGEKDVLVELRQAGLASGVIRTSVRVADSAPEAPQPPPQPPLQPGAPAGGLLPVPADLDLGISVHVESGRAVFHYRLHSPSGAGGFHHHSIRGRPIEGSLENYRARLVEKLEALAASAPADAAPPQVDAVQKLRALGRQLYHDLFPEELRAAYRKLRKAVSSIQICSEEPWIPWEIVCPYDDGDPADVIDDDFLCMQFDLTRWPPGQCVAPGKIRVTQAACVAATDPPDWDPLPYGDIEHAYVKDNVLPGLVDLSPSPADARNVTALLDDASFDLCHFIGHGDLVDGEPVLVLEDGAELRCEDLHGPRQTKIARRRPFVLFNNCRSAHADWGLTRLSGWAATWVERCRAGAFVGPAWCVDDAHAATLCKELYRELAAGQTIGAATRKARAKVRALAPESSTWLAYQVHAHPNARVVFGP